MWNALLPMHSADNGGHACLVCGYDLRGAGGDRCPECGRTVAEAVRWVDHHERRLNILIVGIVCAFLLALLAPMMYCLEAFLPNLGLPVGYYGRLNRVLRDVDRPDNVRIVEWTANFDISIEEVWITAIVDERWKVRIFIPQDVGAHHLRSVVVSRCRVEPGTPTLDYGEDASGMGLSFRLGAAGDLAHLPGGPPTSLGELLSRLSVVFEEMRLLTAAAAQNRRASARSGYAVSMGIDRVPDFDTD